MWSLDHRGGYPLIYGSQSTNSPELVSISISEGDALSESTVQATVDNWELEHVPLSTPIDEQPTQNVILNHRHNYFFVASQWISLLDRIQRLGYDKGINDHIGSLSQLVKNCCRYGKSWSCENDHEIFRPKSCGERHFCPRCGEREGRLRGQIAQSVYHEVADAIPGLSLIHIVFTIPSSKWRSIGYYDAPRLYQVVYKTIKKYFRMSMPGLACFHRGSVSSKNANPHIDMTMLNLGFNPSTSDSELRIYKQGVIDNAYMHRSHQLESFQIVNPFIDVDRLREIYKDELEKEFKWDLDEVVLHTSYVPMQRSGSSARKIAHIVNYSTRYMVVDSYQEVLEGTEYTDRELETLRELLAPPIGFTIRRWFGWLSPSTKRKYLDLLEIEWRSTSDIEKDILDGSDRCKVCGSEMFKVDDQFHDLVENGWYESTEVFEPG